MTCLHQYIHGEEQASVKFTPITAKSPAPLTFRQPHSIARGDREEKRIQVSYQCAIWLIRAGSIIHDQKQEMPHAGQPRPFPQQDHAPEPSDKLNLLLDRYKSESLHRSHPLSPQWKHSKSHLTATGREEVPCGDVPGFVSDESYLLLHSIIRENPGSLIFI